MFPSWIISSELLAHLRQRDIHALFHYMPLHTAPMGEKFGYRPGDLPITEDLAARLLRLPFFYEITPDQQQQVVDAIEEYFTSAATIAETLDTKSLSFT